MTSSSKKGTLLLRYARIYRNAFMLCAIAGFAVVVPIAPQIAAGRLLLDVVLLISMGMFAGRLLRTQTRSGSNQSSDGIDAAKDIANRPEQIGEVQPLGQMQAPAATDVATAATSAVTISQQQLKRLHDQLQQAQKANGEKPLDLKSLQEIVTSTTKQIFAQHSCQGVAFEVVCHEGKVTLQPRIVREPQSPQAPENKA
ncbi:MAG: MXAN_5187 C-terminal domain-containing protein [Myxococcota bacterium]